MKKYLITGFSGFVSNHFIDYLESENINSMVLGVDLLLPTFQINNYKYVKCTFEKIDLLNKNQVDNIIYQFQPDYILHLASFSSVAYSWKEPISSFQNNTNIFLNLLEIVRALGLKCRILSVGSSEEYGNVTEKDLPLKEDHVLNPVSPYAVARISQEMLSKVYVEGFEMDIVMTRSFNHIGPRQRDIFVVSSFARQIMEMKRKGFLNGELITGDISIVRDFLNVRDVVAAYYGLLKDGHSGEVYNVCSGNGITLEEIINKIARIAGIDVEPKISDHLIRPSDNRMIIGSNEKIKKAIGWNSTISLDESLLDLVDYWGKQFLGPLD